MSNNQIKKNILKTNLINKTKYKFGFKNIK